MFGAPDQATRSCQYDYFEESVYCTDYMGDEIHQIGFRVLNTLPVVFHSNNEDVFRQQRRRASRVDMTPLRKGVVNEAIETNVRDLPRQSRDPNADSHGRTRVIKTVVSIHKAGSRARRCDGFDSLDRVNSG